jgi:predicted flap endonuclease-1-like 5' DNA nuclease
MRVVEVEGIGPAYAEKLEAAGVENTDALLAQAGSPAGRTKLAEATGISGTLLLEWCNHADLMRLKGVGSEYADLLEAAGVDSCAELANRNPANLAAKMTELNEQRKLVRSMPTESMVSTWIAEAKAHDKVVFH